MDTIPITALLLILGTLIIFSAMFSASETAMMAVNRYRLKHKADSGHRAARLVLRLLEQPDRLLGTILIGNNITNLAASSLATIIGLKLYGNAGVAIATGILILVVLIFAEVAPKTLAASYPEVIAFPAAFVLFLLQRLFLPFVWMVNLLANSLLRLFGINQSSQPDALSLEELRAAVLESSGKINSSYQDMLLGVLEMDNTTVNDVMVPSNEIEAINFDDSWANITQQIASSKFTRVPVYEKNMDNILGILHLRKILPLINSDRFTRQTVSQLIRKPYFIPENMSITKTLKDLQSQRRRFALVVDEYGGLKGLVTMEEILEEIVGDFTRFMPGGGDKISVAKDGSVIVSGSTNIRDINRKLDWQIPTEHAKTINGLVLHYLEEIPQNSASLRVDNFIFEIMRTSGTLIHSVRIILWKKPGNSE